MLLTLAVLALLSFASSALPTQGASSPYLTKAVAAERGEGDAETYQNLMRNVMASEILDNLQKFLAEDQDTKKKRMFRPFYGHSSELPAIKRQIRYHQCYFNPISCFRRK